MAHRLADKGVFSGAVLRCLAHSQLQPDNSPTNAASDYAQKNKQTLSGVIVGSAGPAITGPAELVRQSTARHEDVEGSLMELQQDSQELADLMGDSQAQLVAAAWAGTWRLIELWSGGEGETAFEQLPVGSVGATACSLAAGCRPCR